MPIDPERFAQRLIELGEAHALGQEERAEKIGVSRRQYKRWERGEVVPRMSNVRKVCGAYEIQPSEFLGEVGDPKGSFNDRLERIERGIGEILKRLDAPEPAGDDADLERARDAAERIEREEQQQTEDAAPPRTVRRAQKR